MKIIHTHLPPAERAHYSVRGYVSEHLLNQRLDRILAQLFPDYSRTCCKQLIVNGKVRLGEMVVTKPSFIVTESSEILVAPPDISESQVTAESIELDICYEDDDILVVNKPAAMVTHVGAENWSGTLQNALLYYHPPNKILPRAGIVHRLDKGTSGLLVCAKTAAAQTGLIEQLKAQSVHREYIALVYGHPPATGRIDAPIGRSKTNYLRMQVLKDGRPAATTYQVERTIGRFSQLRCWLHSGRTHQIRVHLEYLGHPIIADPLYKKRAYPLPLSLQRQALHAYRLQLDHPATGQSISCTAPLPDDMQQAIATMESWKK